MSFTRCFRSRASAMRTTQPTLARGRSRISRTEQCALTTVTVSVTSGASSGEAAGSGFRLAGASAPPAAAAKTTRAKPTIRGQDGGDRRGEPGIRAAIGVPASRDVRSPGGYAAMNRGDAAAATWIFRGDEERRRRGWDAEARSRTARRPSSMIFDAISARARRGRVRTQSPGSSRASSASRASGCSRATAATASAFASAARPPRPTRRSFSAAAAASRTPRPRQPRAGRAALRASGARGARRPRAARRCRTARRRWRCAWFSGATARRRCGCSQGATARRQCADEPRKPNMLCTLCRNVSSCGFVRSMRVISLRIDAACA